MDRVFAEFEEHCLATPTTVTRRRDTRIYFGHQGTISRETGHCVGAFFLQNPGSATQKNRPIKKPDGFRLWPWGAVDHCREDLMPLVIAILDDALGQIRCKAPTIAESLQQCAYVQLLNLSYIKNAADSDMALQQWRQILKLAKDRDDVPRTNESLRFVVFGWGAAYRDSEDGLRVSSTLASFVTDDVWLVFPAAKTVRVGDPLTKEKVTAVTAESIRRQIKKPNNYPCGGRNERSTYPPLYQKSVSQVLAEILLA